MTPWKASWLRCGAVGLVDTECSCGTRAPIRVLSVPHAMPPPDPSQCGETAAITGNHLPQPQVDCGILLAVARSSGPSIQLRKHAHDAHLQDRSWPDLHWCSHHGEAGRGVVDPVATAAPAPPPALGTQVAILGTCLAQEPAPGWPNAYREVANREPAGTEKAQAAWGAWGSTTGWEVPQSGPAPMKVAAVSVPRTYLNHCSDKKSGAGANNNGAPAIGRGTVAGQTSGDGGI